MSKTLHQKLTSKTSFLQTSGSQMHGSEVLLGAIRFERDIQESLSADLLQPRPQAITALLEMVRNIPNRKDA